MTCIKSLQKLDAEASSRLVAMLTSKIAYDMHSISDETHFLPKGKKSWVIM
jgi:c-di-GMP-binding flagellar brake protein YcgR